jgi:sugar phosphate isomerase/epimerase
MHASRLSLNTATVRVQWDLAQCIEGCARHGFGGIAPWLDGVAAMGLAHAARHIRDAGLRVSGLCRGGLFTAGRLADAIEDNKRAIDEAAELKADCLVIVAGGLLPGSKDIGAARAVVAEGLAAIVPYARAAGVAIAIEPLHPMTCPDRSVVCSLAHAIDLADMLGEGVGVVVDVYHVWWDPALEAGLARSGGRILAFHVSDYLVPTRDIALDRGMMGDGAIDIARIHGMVEAAGYAGLIEVEIFSERDWWRRDPDDVLDIIKARSPNFLGTGAAS